MDSQSGEAPGCSQVNIHTKTEEGKNTHNGGMEGEELAEMAKFTSFFIFITDQNTLKDFLLKMGKNERAICGIAD